MGGHSYSHKNTQNQSIYVGGLFHFAHLTLWGDGRGNQQNQITDEEKLIIATLQSAFTAVIIHNGIYPFSDLVKILAQNVTSFTKRYTPYEHPRIMQYL